MKVRVDANELARIMKVMAVVTSQRLTGDRPVEITYRDDGLVFYAANSSMSARMTVPMMGGDGERVCLDSELLNRVARMSSREVEIVTEGNSCVVRGNGRTRMSVMNAKIPEMTEITGTEISVKAADFKRAESSVRHAVAKDHTRLILTGVLMETEKDRIHMTALDGFQMSNEWCNAECEEGINVVIPGVSLRNVCESLNDDDEVRIRTNRHCVQFYTENTVLSCVTLTGEYVDYKKIIPTEFKAACRIRAEDLKEALKGCAAINSKQNLVKLRVGSDVLVVSSNSEVSDYEREIDCDFQGAGLTIAFNAAYLNNAINTLVDEYVTLYFDSPTSPMIMTGEGTSKRLACPVRVSGGA